VAAEHHTKTTVQCCIIMLLNTDKTEWNR